MARWTVATAAVAVLAVVLAPAALAACPTVAFGPRIVHGITTGSPYVGAVRDVNNDGFDDVTIFYNDDFRFQTFLSNGDGTLTPRTSYFLGGGAAALDAGNLDGDGLADVAVGSDFSVKLYAGHGDGTYSAQTILTTASAPTNIFIRDLNGDGRNDVLVVNGNSSKAVVFLQTGAWTFSAGTPFDIASLTASAVVADLDGDGKLDLAVAAYDAVDVLFGHGDGTFEPRLEIAVPRDTIFKSSFTLATGDVNADGRIDIITGRLGNGASIIVNDGSRAFHLGSDLAPGVAAYEIRLADLNLDGLPDLILNDYGGFTTLLALPGGGFGAPVFWPIPELHPGDPQIATAGFYFEIGDTRGDGHVDLVGRVSPSFNNWNVMTYPTACVPPPALTSVVPSSGPTTGSSMVTVFGTSLATTTQVLFGGVPQPIIFRTGRYVQVAVPAVSGPKIVDVQVTTSGGTATLPNGYRYAYVSSVALTTDPAIVIRGVPVTLIATVNATASGGTVTFTDGSTTLGTASVASHRATLKTTFNTDGIHTITASFSGTAVDLASSATLPLHVYPPLALTLDAPSTIPQPGGTFRVTAHFAPPFTGGTLVFTDNGVPVAAPIVNGVASHDFAATNGWHVIVAGFPGDDTRPPVSASAAVSIGAAADVPTLSDLALLALVLALGAFAVGRLGVR